MMAVTPVLVFEERLLAVCKAAGLPVELVTEPDAQQLSGAELVVMGPRWEQLRGWRAAGYRFAAVAVRWGAPPPEDRVLLEPLAMVGEPEPEALGDAVASLQAGLAARTLELEVGRVDLVRRQVHRRDGVVRLTQREADLLAYLAARPHRDVDRDELQVQVWGHVKATRSRSVDMAVLRLRRKVEHEPTEPRNLLTSRGGGYRLVLGAPKTHTLTNLATPVNRFVGREPLLERLAARLAQERRLITVLGAPGAGKTRLARELARREHGPRWPGGLWFCDLVPARDEGGVCLAVAGELGIALGDVGQTEARERLAQALAQRGRTLLVLDNAEHLISAVRGVLGPWLARCPELAVVVTSQRRLVLPGEQLVELDPLTPSEARALFLARAESVGGQLQDARGLDELLALLDHLPLAIELAAARTRSLGVDELRQHLDQRFRLLRGAAQDGVPRHASLHAALQWSWELLSPQLQSCLAALSVFVGGFDTPSARSVLSATSSPGPDLLDTSELLEALLDRSLLLRSGRRWRLLGSVRAFAQQACPAELLASARREHQLCFAAVARTAEAGWNSPNATALLERLAMERGNLLVAWSGLAGQGDVPNRTRLSLALDMLNEARGLPEGRVDVLMPALSEAVVARDREAEARLRLALGRARSRSDRADAAREFRRAVRLARDLGLLDLQAQGLVELAHVRLGQGSPKDAIELAEQAWELRQSRLGQNLAMHLRVSCRMPVERPVERMWENLVALEEAGRLRDAFSAGTLLSTVMRITGRPEGLSRLHERLRGLRERLPLPHLEALLLHEEGVAAMVSGQWERALKCFERGRQVAIAAAPSSVRDAMTNQLAIAAIHLGEHDRAWAWVQEVLRWKRDSGDTRGEIYALSMLGVLHLDRGEPARAREVLERAEHMFGGRVDGGLALTLKLLQSFVSLAEGDAARVKALLANQTTDFFPPRQMQRLALMAVAANRSGDADELEYAIDNLEVLLQRDTLPAVEDWRALLEVLRHPADLSALLERQPPAHALVRVLARAALPR